jgi:hypothetical protein
MNTPAFGDLKDFDIPTMNPEAWPHVMIYHFANAKGDTLVAHPAARIA